MLLWVREYKYLSVLNSSKYIPISGIAGLYDNSIFNFLRNHHTVFYRLYRYSLCGGSDGKASACNVGDSGSIPGLGRSPGEGHGNPLKYSCLEKLMDGGAWQATVHGVAKSRTRLSDFTYSYIPFYIPINTAQVRLYPSFSFVMIQDTAQQMLSAFFPSINCTFLKNNFFKKKNWWKIWISKNWIQTQNRFSANSFLPSFFSPLLK